jgi:hypothetical protein
MATVISPLDRLNYFKGVLLLIQEQQQNSGGEQEYLRSIAELLKLDALFYDFMVSRVIQYLEPIVELPQFSSKQMATIFIRDSLKIAISRKMVIPRVIPWLLQVVVQNNLNTEWLFEEIFRLVELSGPVMGSRLEIEQYV